jgi:hypothetical protein
MHALPPDELSLHTFIHTHLHALPPDELSLFRSLATLSSFWSSAAAAKTSAVCPSIISDSCTPTHDLGCTTHYVLP